MAYRLGCRWPRGMTVDLAHWCQSGMRRKGDIVSPDSVVAPESALGSVPTVALSSAQVEGILARARAVRHCSSNSRGVR